MSKMRISFIVAVASTIAAPVVMADVGDSIIRFGVESLSPSGDLSFDDSLNGLFVTPGELPGLSDSGIIDVPLLAGMAEADSGVGLFFSYESMVSDLVGIEVGISFASLDVEVVQSGSGTFDPTLTGPPVPITITGIQPGELKIAPVTLGANFHLTPDSSVDFYVGPFVAYVLYGDVELDGLSISVTGSETASGVFDESDELGVDADFGFGGVVGIDVPFGDGTWAFAASARYISTTAEVENLDGAPLEFDLDPLSVKAGLAARF